MENDVKYGARANNYETKILKKKRKNMAMKILATKLSL